MRMWFNQSPRSQLPLALAVPLSRLASLAAREGNVLEQNFEVLIFGDNP